MVEIRPEPDAVEREAILAALALEDSQERTASVWAEALLPRRDSEAGEP